MGALGLHPGGPRFGESDTRSRCLLLSDTCAVRGLTRAASGVRRLFIDVRSPFAKARELRRKGGNHGARPFVFGPDRSQACFEARDALAGGGFRRGGIRGGDSAELFLLPRRSEILI